MEEDDGGAPWHDQTLPLAERMKLADDKPLRWKLMAAMAQQDCGQCGYDCKNYSDAIFEGKEARLNLCVPGGKDTARMLKALHGELGSAPAKSWPSRRQRRCGPRAARAGASRARLFARQSGRGDAGRAPAAQQNGLPEGDLALRVRPLVLRARLCGRRFLRPLSEQRPGAGRRHHQALDAPPDFPIGGKPLRDVLLRDVSLAPAPDMLFQLFSYIAGGERRKKARALANGEDPDGDAATLDVLAAIEKFPGVRPDPEAFVEALDPLQPRLYSISSSPKANPGRVSLTVDAVRYDIGPRRGSASLDLSGRARRRSAAS